jgi:two-component system, sensor histidine kinase and response regulator
MSKAPNHFFPENNGINILLVDDKESNLLALSDMLERKGRKFIKAQSGNEALKIVLNQPIGLIMLDVQMPEMDGFEVAKILKSNPKTKDIAIIFVTAISKEEEYALKGFDEGAVDYLYKPLDTNITKAKVAVFETLYYQQQALKNSIREIANINKQLDDFVHIVSHDLKTPLNGILGLTDFIEEDVEEIGDETIKENLRLLKSCARSMVGMINGILEYSKSNRSEYKKEKIDMNALLKDLLGVIFPPVNFTIKIQPDLPVITGDRIRIQQVFQNFISNAIKYNDKTNGEIEITYEAKPDCHEFSVSDNGPGIAPRNHNRIFQIFQTINPINEVESTGVGLAIVKSIIENQGGKITVDSDLGKGAKFTFQWMK